MYFDDVLVRKDGRFVLPELEALNLKILNNTGMERLWIKRILQYL